MTTTARKIHQYVPNHVGFTVNYNTAGITAGVEFPNRIPAGSVINTVTVINDVAFNGTTSVALNVGYTPTGSDLISAMDVRTARSRNDTNTPIASNPYRSADTQIYASLVFGGTVGTAGTAYIVVEYFPVVG
jgi:hypothetical protein